MTAPWGTERAHHGGAGLWTEFTFVSLHVGPRVCPGRAPVPAFEVTSGARQLPPTPVAAESLPPQLSSGCPPDA